jgi:ribonuclease P protein 1
LEKIRKIRIKEESDNIKYGIGNNFMIRRITPTTMNKLYLWNCLKGHMFGNKIIFDCSYGNFMSLHETRSCARQFLECYSANRHHNFPFDIYMCNVDTSSEFIQHLYKFIPTLFDDDFPINISTKSFVELFDKKQLVYLSSNSNIEMVKYDPNAVYIIGAFVDKVNLKDF